MKLVIGQQGAIVTIHALGFAYKKRQASFFGPTQVLCASGDAGVESIGIVIESGSPWLQFTLIRGQCLAGIREDLIDAVLFRGVQGLPGSNTVSIAVRAG